MYRNSPKNKNYKPKSRNVKPELPGGFRDYGPAEAILRQRLFSKIRNTFEVFGFEPMETPSVERTEVLLGGERESDKVIFNVSSSKKSEYKEKAKLSLRFDLTVPLSRFVAANPEVPKPFKRYQIGQVFRGESPQTGRYREFTQADIDIVGSSSLDADIEIAEVIFTTLQQLGLKNFVIKINNRKILNALPELAGFPPKQLRDALRILDKEDKIGKDEVIEQFAKTFNKKVAKQIKFFLEDIREERSVGFTSLSKQKIVEEGSYELLSLFSALRGVEGKQKVFQFDPTMVRGLSYYTGIIFEAVLTDIPEIGSIFGGGRYDNLIASFTGQKIPAIGASLGVDRLMAAFEKLGKFQPPFRQETTVKVLILNLSGELRPEYFSISKELRDGGINTALYLGDDRAFQAQLAYAVKKEIPYVLIYGAEEKKKGVVTVKNLATREQKEIPKQNILDLLRKDNSTAIS